MITEGKRIYLREYVPGDFNDFYSLVSDPEVRSMSLLNTAKTEEDGRKEFNMIINEQQNPERRLFIYAAVLMENDVYIGDCGFEIHKLFQPGGIIEIGYFLFKKFRGKGYATEIAGLLIDYCFENFPVHKIIASCDKRNTASEKIMIKCGMKKEGEFKKSRYKDGKWYDDLKYAVFRKEQP